MIAPGPAIAPAAFPDRFRRHSGGLLSELSGLSSGYVGSGRGKGRLLESLVVGGTPTRRRDKAVFRALSQAMNDKSPREGRS